MNLLMRPHQDMNERCLVSVKDVYKLKEDFLGERVAQRKGGILILECLKCE